MRKVNINGKNFVAMCSECSPCCVAIRKEDHNFLIIDTKDPEAAPLVIKEERWESFKAEVQAGKFNLTKLSERALDSSYHGISVRKIHSHILICDTINSAEYSLAFSLKEWNAFTEGAKKEDFDDNILSHAA